MSNFHPHAEGIQKVSRTPRRRGSEYTSIRAMSGPPSLSSFVSGAFCPSCIVTSSSLETPGPHLRRPSLSTSMACAPLDVGYVPESAVDAAVDEPNQRRRKYGVRRRMSIPTSWRRSVGAQPQQQGRRGWSWRRGPILQALMALLAVRCGMRLWTLGLKWLPVVSTRSQGG